MLGAGGVVAGDANRMRRKLLNFKRFSIKLRAMSRFFPAFLQIVIIAFGIK